ncbi:hypothetical protein [Bradyrhizobium sp. LHD-71]|uniref:hypothetical protein n=1 Tax=Bradyrhizobium sp. LHD-71 TaxID=3072141 RepID=UPI00280D27C2|nr:hypothetical protein [Bradyrhizobium sp. LHD-71]MDQ8728457.1 hypothetical protein [Bradyrhizobium sp. LHD-71]
MADDAFALSPIHARPSLPTDADYHAIHEAFMETARGRWFLTEYAKRNRNADTRMVLEAVERIETTLASQRQAQAEAVAQAEANAQADAQALSEPEPAVDLWPDLAKAFTKVRIEIAQRLLRESNEQAFEAIRRGVETIKSISWALRERGFDSRICDMFDAQVNAITDGYTGVLAERSVAGDIEVEVLAAFDGLMQHVEATTRGEDAETDALDMVVDAIADAMSEDDGAFAMSFDDDATADAAPSSLDEPQATIVEPAPAEVAAYPDAAFHEIYGDDSDIEIVDAAPVGEPASPTEPEINRQRLYEAKLEPYRFSTATAPARAQHVSLADDIEIIDVASAEAERVNAAAADERCSKIADVAPLPVSETPVSETKAVPIRSLGEALIVNGVIQNPTAARPDALAPFRRMSQAEKVAFFT